MRAFHPRRTSVYAVVGLFTPSFYEHHRSGVNFLAVGIVIDNADEKHAQKHHDGPVEAAYVDGRPVGPEAPEEGESGVQEPTGVDRHPEAAQAPARGG